MTLWSTSRTRIQLSMQMTLCSGPPAQTCTVHKPTSTQACVTLWTYCNLWKLKLNTNNTIYTIFSRRYKVKKSVKIRYGGEEIQKDDAPQYLGLQLDPKLSMRKHIENTAAKARRRLNIVKKLASTKQTLRQLYMGYIRPTLEYSSAALSTATHTNLATLDKVQNQALRFISGAMKTTPTSACEIQCNIEPLDIRRDAAIFTTYERYQRLEHSPRHGGRRHGLSSSHI